MAKDYYKILGVDKNANTDEIKKAYRKLALKYHPDRGGGEDESKKFKEINEAYQIISDPQKRSQYDQFGTEGPFGGGFSSAGQGGGFSGFEGFDFGGFSTKGESAGGWNFAGGLGDIFDDFFGQAFTQVQAEIRITPAQAVLGDKLELTIDGQKINLDLPAGVQDGQAFRIAGKGRAHNKGRGDLILTVRIEMPRHINKEQKELWEKLRDSENRKKHWWG